MRKAVNTALQTKYESKPWKKWFVETAKRLSEQLDADSANGNVRVRLSLCLLIFVHITCYAVVSLFAFARCLFMTAYVVEVVSRRTCAEFRCVKR